MATLPQPSTIISRPAYDENRITSRFDTPTKSTKQNVVAYIKQDTCGRDVYAVIQFSASINQLVDCVPVLAASMSHSYLVPIRNVDGTLMTATQVAAQLSNYLNFDGAATHVYTTAEVEAAVTIALATIQD